MEPAKISEEASCSVIHLQGHGSLHHNGMLVIIPACVCMHVYMYTHPVVCTLYTHRDTVCTWGCAPHQPYAGCVSALQCTPTAPAGHILGPGAMAQLSSVCTAVPLLCTSPRAPPILPEASWMAWGRDLPRCTACSEHHAGCWCSTLPGDVPC